MVLIPGASSRSAVTSRSFCRFHYYAFLVTTGLAGYEDQDGVCHLEVYSAQWKDYFLKDETYGSNVKIAEVDSATCDIDALIAGTNQDNANRKKVHVLCIRDRKDPAYQSSLPKRLR